MPPRGVKRALAQTAPARATRSAKYGVVFRAGKDKRSGARLRGVTRLLQRRVWSKGALPAKALFGEEDKGGHWKGPSGGKRRGSAVDAQVCRLASMSEARRRAAKKLRLVDLIFRALHAQGMEPIMGQRVVCDSGRGLGTAVDLVCSRGDALILVELKTGYSGNRTLSAKSGGQNAKLQYPFRTANDTILNRHLAQLTATTAMYIKEVPTLERLSALGLKRVEAALLYATNDDVEVHALPQWWYKRGERLLGALQ
jgi:hypothetical protein